MTSDRQTHRQADRQTDRQTDRQRDRQTDRRKDSQTMINQGRKCKIVKSKLKRKQNS